MTKAIEDIISVHLKKVVCSGQAGTSGHPVIYLNIGPSNEIICPYCSKKFIYSPKDKLSKTPLNYEAPSE